MVVPRLRTQIVVAAVLCSAIVATIRGEHFDKLRLKDGRTFDDADLRSLGNGFVISTVDGRTLVSIDVLPEEALRALHKSISYRPRLSDDEIAGYFVVGES